MIVALAGLMGCETSQNAKRSDVKNDTPKTTIDTDALVADAEKARDRALQIDVSFERVESDKLVATGPAVPDAVTDDRAFLLEHLFGTTAQAPPTGDPLTSLATFDAESNTIRYREGETIEDTERAIFSAIVRAIDIGQFDAPSTPDSWDAYLAQETAKGATGAFAIAARAASNVDGLDAKMLARRPELVTRLDAVTFMVQPPSEASKRTISTRERHFIRREAWTLAAALYRANGWSGVELGWLMSPRHSADVVQPGNWLSGEPVAQWEWPDAGDDEPARAGRVGAAVTSLWLSNTVSAGALRTLFAGWTSDQYRYWSETDERPARLEWLTLWDSPGSASQVTKAFELTLRERFPTDPEANFVVFQKGLKVGVILSEEPPEQRKERAKMLLDAKVQFEPRQGLPISFVPTRSDVIARKAGEATLEEQQWSDPASGLQMNLASLAEWKIDRPKDSAVRWFARGPNGALTQLTMEMRDPLGPEFGSNEYRDDLRDAFTKTMADTEISGISNVEMSFGRTLQATVSGALEGSPTKIRFWHFKIDDLIFTYSYQAPVATFAEHAEKARIVIESTELQSSDSGTDEAGEGSGIIEFEVEEN